jgi:exosome complex RNA-binding protein Rrp42 (RNase PH superfamily)
VILDISVIKNDGNIFDTAIIAALSSWLTYKIPFFRIKEGELYYDSFINLTTIITLFNEVFNKTWCSSFQLHETLSKHKI